MEIRGEHRAEGWPIFRIFHHHRHMCSNQIARGREMKERRGGGGGGRGRSCPRERGRKENNGERWGGDEMRGRFFRDRFKWGCS